MTKKTMIRTVDMNLLLKSKTILFICILFYAFHADGEIIKGRIINNNGSPIREAVIINTTRASADYTNDEGFFTIHASYGDSLLISCAGDDMHYIYSSTSPDIVFVSRRKSLFSEKPIISEQVINQINTLYLSEQYRACISYCLYYVGVFPEISPYESHPYRDFGKKNWFLSKNNAEHIATVCYLGAISAYQYSLSKWDKTAIFEGIEWSKSCVAFYDDYLHEETPRDYWPAETTYNYITYGERGIRATSCGVHLLSAFGNDSWTKKQSKWFNKKSDRIFAILHKNTSNKESLFSEYPLLQYEITSIRLSHMLAKGNYKAFHEVYSDRFAAINKLIEQSSNSYYYSVDASNISNPQILRKQTISNVEIYKALNSLIALLKTTVIDSYYRKKIGKNYERFCVEQLIKLQDVSYSLNGSSIYSLSKDYTLRDIQNCLGDADCAILHFEAPLAPGRLYSRDDLGTKYRNYAFVITKNQETPILWHRGYISDNQVNKLDSIKKSNPNVTKFYFVGTPRMSFIDIAGNDSSIVRLHSLSQLLYDRSSKAEGSEITFIGDLNYKKVGDIDVPPTISESKGGEFEQLKGPAKELAYINTLYTNVRPICGDNATRNVVTSEISRSKGIVHISTHGELFSPNDDFTPDELILKKNIMDNSCVILSGYNDTPHSSLCYMSGSDVLKMKHISSELIFLDACMSGKGAVGASGSVGIAEAFHLIGAKNVICYLEPVNDNVATEFSNRFYLELSKGASYHDAFFRAKKSMNQNIKVILWE